MNSHSANSSWLRLPSGALIDILNPDPGAWLDVDLIQRISRTFRWGGSTRTAADVPLTVAQHSLFVLQLTEQVRRDTLAPIDALRSLLHDLDECLLFDPSPGVKVALGGPFAILTDRIKRAIELRYGLLPWNAEMYTEHKWADLTAAATEAHRCIGWDVSDVRGRLGISHPILDEDPLAVVYDTQPWECWSVDIAEERFAAKFFHLLKSVDLKSHRF